MLSSAHRAWDISRSNVTLETDFLWHYMTTKSAKPENRVALLEVQATLSAKKQAKNSDEDDIFASTRNVIADWVQSLFDIDASVLGEQKVSADDRHITVSASDTLWTCYASYPAPDGSGRTWITEVSLEQKPKSPESVTLSLSQSTLQPANERRMPQPLYPEFLGRLAADFTMKDGRFPLRACSRSFNGKLIQGILTNGGIHEAPIPERR